MGGVNAVNASWRSGTAALSGSAGPGGSYQVWGSAWDTGMALTVHTTPFCTKDLTQFRAVPAARARRPLTRAPGRFTDNPGAPDIYCLRSARSDEQLGLAMARQHLRDLGAISIRRDSAESSRAGGSPCGPSLTPLGAVQLSLEMNVAPGPAQTVQCDRRRRRGRRGRGQREHCQRGRWRRRPRRRW